MQSQAKSSLLQRAFVFHGENPSDFIQNGKWGGEAEQEVYKWPQRSAWEQKDWTRCITYHLDIIISKLLHIFEITILSVDM